MYPPPIVSPLTWRDGFRRAIHLPLAFHPKGPAGGVPPEALNTLVEMLASGSTRQHRSMVRW